MYIVFLTGLITGCFVYSLSLCIFEYVSHKEKILKKFNKKYSVDKRQFNKLLKEFEREEKNR